MSLDYNPLVHPDYVKASKNLSSQNIGAKLSKWAEVQQQFKGAVLELGKHKPTSKEYRTIISLMRQIGDEYATFCALTEAEYVKKMILCAMMFAAKDAGINTDVFRKMLDLPQPKQKKTRGKK